MDTPIRQLMVSAVVLAGEQDTVGEVRERMEDHDIGAVPVVRPDGALVGIVTSDDLLGPYPSTLPISRVMTSPVETLPPETTAAEAAGWMRQKRCHHVVVAEGERLIGIVSAFDLLGLVERTR